MIQKLGLHVKAGHDEKQIEPGDFDPDSIAAGADPSVAPRDFDAADETGEPVENAPVETAKEESTSLVRDGLASSIFFLLGLTVIQKGLGFVRSLAICRYLSPEQLGLWSMTLTVVATLAPLLLLSIPACFARYFEYFENRGQLKSFIRQACWIIAAFFPLGLLAVVWFRGSFSQLIYGSAVQASMLTMVLLIVVPYSLFAVLTHMLNGLRISKSRSLGEFINGISFTVLAILMLVTGRANAVGVGAAFALSYSLSSLYAFWKMRSSYHKIDDHGSELAWGPTWKKIAPVVFVFWLTDFLSNLFFTIDRYMIVNLSNAANGAPLEQIGNYESAHVMPLLLASLTAIIAHVVLPYLSKDWENGRRKSVAIRINLSMKIAAVVLLTAAVLFQLLSGWLFERLFQGKYPQGLEIIPLILVFHVLSAISFLQLNYFWCTEKGRLAVVGVVLGLAVNVGVNLALIPQFGIAGAALGTAAAMVSQILVLQCLIWNQGVPFDWRWLLTLGFCLAPWWGGTVSVVMLVGLIVFFRMGWVTNRRESVLLLRWIDLAAKRLVAWRQQRANQQLS